MRGVGCPAADLLRQESTWEAYRHSKEDIWVMEKESLGEEILAELEVWRRSTERVEGLIEKWNLEV